MEFRENPLVSKFLMIGWGVFRNIIMTVSQCDEMNNIDNIVRSFEKGDENYYVLDRKQYYPTKFGVKIVHDRSCFHLEFY